MTRLLITSSAVASVVLVLVLNSPVPQAQTSGPVISAVSGTVSHGSSLQISGSGFGSKSTAAPLKWDTFENGTDNTALSGWSLSATPDGTRVPRYSTLRRRPNSNLSARADFSNGNWGSNFAITGTPLPRVYLDAWYYYQPASPYSRNHKLFRIHSNTDSPNLYYNLYCATGYSHLSQDGVSGGNYHYWPWIGPEYFAGKWVHLQVYLEESSPGVDDGTALMWIDGVLWVNQVRNFRTRDSSTNWNSIYLGNYVGHGSDASCAASGDAWTFWDDVYIDTTPARIEIGDASTYSATRHREIQIPSAWSSSAISITLNRGGFSSLDGKYLYVTDSAGRVNANGFPLATAPDTTAPTVTAVSPLSGATGVGVQPSITATFSEGMSSSTITTTTFELRNSAGTAVSAAVSYDGATRIATLTPSLALANSATYTATVRGGSGGVKDLAGNALAADYRWSFTTAAPSAPIVNGLVAAYAFSEGTGLTVVDLSGQNNVGTVSGAAWTTSGRYGSGLRFDGVDDWVTVADAATLDLTTGMTLEAWVYPTAQTSAHTVLLKETAAGLAYSLYAHENGAPVTWVRLDGAASSNSATGTSSLPLNTWTHLAATFDGSTLRLFVNAAQVGSRTIGGSLVQSTGALRLGGNAPWGEYFAGVIDEVRVYNRALTASEIATDRDTPIGATATDTVAPTVATVSPVAGAIDVALSVTIGAAFSEAMDATTISSSTVHVRDAASVAIAGSVSYDSVLQRAAFTPAAPLTAAATYTATVRGGTSGVKDLAGNPLAADFTWSFTTVAPVDTTAPTLSWQSPAPGATVSGTVTVAASATDNVGVVGVQFKLDGANLGAEDTTAPYAISWDTAAVSGGSHVLSAVARDAAGNQGASTSISVTVSNTSTSAAGLVAAYGFGEGSGLTISDASGYNNTGIISGATWTTGRFGSALRFDGVDDSVTIADADVLDLTTAMTLQAWVYPTRAGFTETVVLKESPTGLAYSLYSNEGAAPVTWVRFSGSVSGNSAAGSTALPLNVWTHLAATYDGAILRLFVNGSEVGNRPLTGSIVSSSGVLRLGGNAVWGEYFAGVIDEVRIYSRALSASEIQLDMTRGVLGESADTTPPTVTSTTPQAGSVVSPTTTVSVVFSEAMQASTINGTTIQLRDAMNVLVSASVAYNSGTRTAVLTPAAALQLATLHTVTVKGGSNGVTDASSNPLGADVIWTFTIASPPAAPKNLRIVK